MQADHSREVWEMQQKHGREIADKDTRHKQEISFLKTVIAKPIAEWFKEQFEKLRQNMRRHIQPQRKGRGMKI